MASELPLSISAFTNATMEFFTYRVKCICPLTTWIGFVIWHPLVQAWGSRVFLCIWTDNFLWLFLETWGWILFFAISFANEISECLTESWLLVLFLMSLQLSLLLGDSHCFPNAYVWMPIVGSLATASRWKPRLAEARLTLNLYFSEQEKGHCCELMTEQCSEMFDHPALYLCLLPPTVFSFPGHGEFFFLCYLFSFRWGFQHWQSQTETPQVHQESLGH